MLRRPCPQCDPHAEAGRKQPTSISEPEYIEFLAFLFKELELSTFLSLCSHITLYPGLS